MIIASRKFSAGRIRWWRMGNIAALMLTLCPALSAATSIATASARILNPVEISVVARAAHIDPAAAAMNGQILVPDAFTIHPPASLPPAVTAVTVRRADNQAGALDVVGAVLPLESDARRPASFGYRIRLPHHAPQEPANAAVLVVYHCP